MRAEKKLTGERGLAMANPDPSQIQALRESVQARKGLGITAAQNFCADALHTSRRAWQQWERGERVCIQRSGNLHRSSPPCSLRKTQRSEQL
jgi:hypothetical protein